MSPAGQLLLPALVLLPLLALLPASWHGGGFDLIGQFLVAAVQPSTDPALIAASLRGIAVTVAVALWSWLFSLLLGVIGGVLSAEVVSRTLWGCSWPALLLRRVLAIPRSLHELRAVVRRRCSQWRWAQSRLPRPRSPRRWRPATRSRSTMSR